MKKDIYILLALVFGLCVFAFLIGKSAGIEQTKTEYQNRSLHLKEKDYFTNRDIEHILYNTPLD